VNGPTFEEKVRRKEKWHLWFAWYPVTVGITDQQREIRIWWSEVECKGTYYGGFDAFWDWEYREIVK
jgi:hypothetical protein